MHLEKSFFQDKKVVITGATGFIGSQLARRLIDKGSQIFAFTRKTTNRWRVKDIEKKVNWYEQDLCDVDALKFELTKINPDFIYHLATYYSVDNDVNFSEIIDTNIKASVYLLKACEDLRDLKLFINAGTCAEYGDIRDTADEKSPLNPNSVYASTKAANTIILHQLAEDLDIPLTTLRLYNMFGEYENSSRIVPYIILSLVNNKTVDLTGCEQSKDYSYVSDVVNAFLSAANNYQKANGEIFNIGSGKTIKMRELVGEIVENFENKDEYIRFGVLPYRENEMWFQGTSIEKAKKCLNWQPKISLENGLKATVDWYKKHSKLYI